jgi:hypothetical protein
MLTSEVQTSLLDLHCLRSYSAHVQKRRQDRAGYALTHCVKLQCSWQLCALCAAPPGLGDPFDISNVPFVIDTHVQSHMPRESDVIDMPRECTPYL